MKMSDTPTKYEVRIEQYLRSILDISGQICSEALARRQLVFRCTQNVLKGTFS